MKKIVASLICYCLVFNAINLAEFYLSKPTNSSTEVVLDSSLFFNNSYAQADALTLTAKSKTSNMVQYYLPMLVMLGVGMMALAMVKRLEKKSADFYLFLVGAIIYLVSVVTSWTSEKSKIDKLPESIDKNTQVEALRVQKKSFEDALKMVKRRIMFQGASAASFLAAAVLAGVYYSREKANNKEAKIAVQKAIKEAETVCPKHPELNALFDVNTQQPLSLKCQKKAMELSACANEINPHLNEIERQTEVIFNQRGSKLQSIDFKKSMNAEIGQAAYCYNYDVDNVADLSFSSLNELTVKNQFKKVFKEQKINLLEAEKIVLVSSNKVDSSKIQLIKFVLSQLVNEARAGVVTKIVPVENITKGNIVLGEKFVGVGDNKSESFVNQLNNRNDLAMSLCEERESVCSDENLQRYLDFADAKVATNKELIELGTDTGISIAAGGALKHTAAGNKVVKGLTNLGKFVSKNPRTMRVLKVLVPPTPFNIALNVAIFYGPSVVKVVKSKINEKEKMEVISKKPLASKDDAKLKRQNHYERNKRRLKQRKNTSSLFFQNQESQLDRKKQTPLLNRFMKIMLSEAHAKTGISASTVVEGADEIVQDVSEKSNVEADKWIYGPKGRMVFFGAISLLTVFITASTNSMKKNLESDIDKVQGLIDAHNLKNGKSSYLGPSIETDIKEKKESIVSNHPLESLISLFISKAFAAQSPAGKLPMTIPCLNSYRGKCRSVRQSIEDSLIPGINYAPATLAALRSTARIGDMIQRKNYVSSEVFHEVKKLNALKPTMEMGLKVTKKVINTKRVKEYNEKPIPFEKYEKKLMNRLLNIGKKSLAAHKGSVDLAKLFGGGALYKNHNFVIPEKRVTSNNNESEETSSIVSLNTQKTRSQRGSSYQHQFIDPKMMEEIDNISDFDVNTNEHDSLFHQISRRYILWRSRQKDLK